jgi:hypothetical protein
MGIEKLECFKLTKIRRKSGLGPPAAQLEDLWPGILPLWLQVRRDMQLRLVYSQDPLGLLE